MTTDPRRRIRLREDLPAPYVARMPEGEHYTPPPTDPAEDPRLRHVQGPDVLTFGQALLVFADTVEDGVEAWRRVFPESAAVHDGVRSTEAGVIPLEESFRLEGEDDE